MDVVPDDSKTLYLIHAGDRVVLRASSLAPIATLAPIQNFIDAVAGAVQDARTRFDLTGDIAIVEVEVRRIARIERSATSPEGATR